MPAPIPYDPSRTALYTPELGEAQPDFGAAWDIDWIAAELSRLAYYRFEQGDRARLDATLTNAGFTAPATFEFAANSAEAIATTAPDGTAFIACRGTQPDNLRDLASDARAKLVGFQAGGRVHAGFLAAWNAIAGPIGAWLQQTPHDRLVLTGHSLGAAMATVATATRPNARLVTFGSPRVGDSAFADLLSKTVTRRYVDCTDLVTSVPPGLLGYVHVGQHLYIDRFGTVHEAAPDPAAVAKDQRQARLSYTAQYGWKVWRNVATRDFADHAPVNYISGVTGRRPLAVA